MNDHHRLLGACVEQFGRTLFGEVEAERKGRWRYATAETEEPPSTDLDRLAMEHRGRVPSLARSAQGGIRLVVARYEQRWHHDLAQRPDHPPQAETKARQVSGAKNDIGLRG